MRRSRPVVLVLAVAITSVVACADDNSVEPIATGASPSTSRDASTAPSSSPVGVAPEGFGTIAARVTAADGEVCELCLWLADDPGRRGRGLMHVTDLAGMDGMAFRYDGPHTTTFTMRNTVMPLSIVFYGAAGEHLDEFDMDPCAVEPCDSYPTPADFVVAVEVPRGGLAARGFGAGSTLELLAEGCSAGDRST